MALRKPVVDQTPEASKTEALVGELLEAGNNAALDAKDSNAQVVEGGNQPDENGVQDEPEVISEAKEGAKLDEADKIEPEVIAEQAKPAAEAAQALAVKEESTAVSVQQKRESAMQNFTQEMANQGFEGLNVTGMSFDRIKLHEGKFLLGSDEADLGDEVLVQIHGTRPIYIVRQSDEEDAPVFYSYSKDGSTLSDGSSSEALLGEWREDGYATTENPVGIKEYLECLAQLKNREDEYDDLMVSLSVPPASKDRLGGACAVAYQRFKCAPDGVIIRCKVGKKVGEGKKAFRPWVFTCVGKIEA